MTRMFITSIMMAALMLFAGTALAADKEPFRIALLDPLSGPMAATGEMNLRQLQFFAEKINEKGGINGHEVKVIGFDNKVSPQESLIQMDKAVGQGIRYIAQSSGSSVAAALINAVNKYNDRNPDNRLVYLDLAALDPSFTNELCSFWHFRFYPHTAMLTNLLTEYIARQKDMKKVFLINQDYSYGHMVAKGAIDWLKEKRPDIEIVGNVFVPMGKVKDFSPYISQIKASGADVVITGNWGQDITLLVKSAASYGLDTPFVTLFGNQPGAVSQIGSKGVDRLYTISPFNGDFEDPEMAKLQVELYEKTKYDFVYINPLDIFEMLKAAAEKADSIDPTKLAFALAGLEYDSPVGPVTMRAEDHQIAMPMFMTVLKDKMKYGVEGTDLNYHSIHKFSAEETELPTTCKMRPPKD